MTQTIKVTAFAHIDPLVTESLDSFIAVCRNPVIRNNVLDMQIVWFKDDKSIELNEPINASAYGLITNVSIEGYDLNIPFSDQLKDEIVKALGITADKIIIEIINEETK